jgi:hypothetical protein
MKTSKMPSALLAIVPISFIALFLAPVASAYSSGDNWQIGVSGTGTECIPNVGCGGFGFWGWCAFSGATSGTSGDCQYSQYLHLDPLSTQCETHFDITSWHVALGRTGLQSFFIDSGTVTVDPASATTSCIHFLQHAGFNVVQSGSDTGQFLASSDTGIPATPGHYDFSGEVRGPITFTEFQIQVTDS